MNPTSRSLANERTLVHGMERDVVTADWPALTDDEVFTVFTHIDGPGSPGARTGGDGRIRVTWSSPRPMSAAAMVRGPRGEYFVKRHHVAVRDAERLRVEHAFARHLRERGQPVAKVLAGPDGDTVIRRGDFVYEVHDKAPGVDLYREHPSWYPYDNHDHARAAGAALARCLIAANDFAVPATPPGVLTNSMVVVASNDPLATLHHLIDSRPALARALEYRDVDADVSRRLIPAAHFVAPLLARLTPQWGHGDWHPSNLTWTAPGSGARVAGILDLGLANRTTAVHDLAVALERSVVDWLDLTRSGEVRADLVHVDAFLDGYESVRPLDQNEWSALIALLPVVHLEFALSEVEYFADVVRSEKNTALAYEGYLLGHARWFEESNGVELLAHLQSRWPRHESPTA